MAVAGRCDFKVSCLVQGCGRPLCKVHLSGVDPRANYVKFHRDQQVCVECVTRAKRGKAYSIALLIILFLIVCALIVACFSLGSQEVEVVQGDQHQQIIITNQN